MHTPYLIYALAAAASLFSGCNAGPCKASSSTNTETPSTPDATSLSPTSTPTITPTTTPSLSSTPESTSTSTSSTTSAQPIPTFSIQGANCDVAQVNDAPLQYRGSGYPLLFLVPNALTSYYQEGVYHLEDSTNYLMVNDLYVVGAAASNSGLKTTSYIDTRDYPIVCTPPTQEGQTLQCTVAWTDRTQWETGLDQGNAYEPYLFTPGTADSSGFAPFDLIVSASNSQ